MNDGPRPSAISSAILLGALCFAHLSSNEEFASSSAMAREVALIVGFGILASLIAELQQGYRNLIRTDLVCIGVIYVLTLLELLQAQPEFDETVTLSATKGALDLVLLAFAGLVLGRHLPFFSYSAPADLTNDLEREIPCDYLFKLACVCMAFASFHMILATKGNIVQIFEAMMNPRFGVPWARGRLGGWRELLNELGLLFFIIPPLTAILTIRRREITLTALTITWAFCFVVLFKAFGGGTRNIFLTHLLSFAGAYLVYSPKMPLRNVIAFAGIFCTIAAGASYFMLEFRRVGLRDYLAQEMYTSETRRDSLSIDDNLTSISAVVEVFPAHYPHLGWEIPIWALVKPIPRSLWPGKPEGLSISIEEALNGNDSYTIATTYIGEAYMAFGAKGVFFISILFGGLATAWTNFAGSQRGSMEVVIFSSGFFTAAITMRSFLWMTTAMLPTIAILVVWRYYLKPRASVATNLLGTGDYSTVPQTP